MVFGFNSEVKSDATVYHVQSELRVAERLLDTQVFVGGRCLGKHSAGLPHGTGQSDEQIQDALREQHRRVVAAIREGELDRVLAVGLQCLQVESTPGGMALRLRFRVENISGPIRARLLCKNEPPVYARAEATNGVVAFEFPFDTASRSEATLLVQYDGAHGPQLCKFRLCRQPSR